MNFTMPSTAIDYDFLHGVCVGQASNPGPWSLRIQNIVSAQKHLDSLVFKDDCIVWTETSATRTTQERALRISTRYHAGFSHPASPKILEKTGRNEATGTMIFSKAPLQDMSGNMDAAIFHTSRIADCILNLAGVQVRVVSIYAYHSGFEDQMIKNERLFAHAFAAASEYNIPTIVTGDFNCDLQQLQCWEKAVTLGFVDVGLQIATLNNQEPQPTYRGESRLDYLVLNRIAIQALQSFDVDPKGFTDHAVLHAQFNWDALAKPQPTWTFSHDLAQLQSLHEPMQNTSFIDSEVAAFDEARVSGSPQHLLTAFTTAFEAKLQRVHQCIMHAPLPSTYLGRGSGKIQLTKPQRVTVCRTTKQATDRCQLSYRFKTLDRVRELLHYTLKGHAIATRWRTWNKILKSQGFSPDFATWILDEDIASYVPLSLPAEEWLQHLLSGLQSCARHWDAHQRKQKRQQASQFFKHDWKSGGRHHAQAVKDPNFGTVQGLLQHSMVQLGPQTGLTETTCCRVADPSSVVIGSTWTLQGNGCTVKDVENDVVKLSVRIPGLQKSALVSQSHWCSDTSFVASEIREYWNGYWNTGNKPDAEVMHRLAALMPSLPVFDATVTVQDLRDIIRKLPRGKARGLDSWRYVEFKLMTDEELMMLTQLFNQVLNTGE